MSKRGGMVPEATIEFIGRFVAGCTTADVQGIYWGKDSDTDSGLFEVKSFHTSLAASCDKILAGATLMKRHTKKKAYQKALQQARVKGLINDVDGRLVPRAQVKQNAMVRDYYPQEGKS